MSIARFRRCERRLMEHHSGPAVMVLKRNRDECFRAGDPAVAIPCERENEAVRRIDFPVHAALP